MFSLENHSQQYSLSGSEVLQSVVLSPYALRHWELAKGETSCVARWGHRVVAILEAIPVFSLLATLIDRIVAVVANCFHKAPQPIARSEPHPVGSPRHVAVSSPVSTLKVAKVVKKEEDTSDAILLDFCRHIPQCADLMKGKPDASAVREWLKDPRNTDQITGIAISNQKLKGIPEEIRHFTKLTSLTLPQNEIESLPESIGSLASLEELDLSGNRLQALPDSFYQLKALRWLSLDGNNLTEISADISALDNLGNFGISGNKLKSVPPEVGKLQALRRLDLCNNCLTDIPEELGSLQVSMLSLIGNQLTTVPATLAKNKRLRDLNLDNNQIQQLPPEILALNRGGKKKKIVTFSGNPIKNPPAKPNEAEKKESEDALVAAVPVPAPAADAPEPKSEPNAPADPDINVADELEKDKSDAPQVDAEYWKQLLGHNDSPPVESADDGFILT